MEISNFHDFFAKIRLRRTTFKEIFCFFKINFKLFKPKSEKINDQKCNKSQNLDLRGHFLRFFSNSADFFARIRLSLDY